MTVSIWEIEVGEDARAVNIPGWLVGAVGTVVGLVLAVVGFLMFFDGRYAPASTATDVEVVGPGLRMHDLARSTGIGNLCLAGGVALNCVANGKLARQGSFENIWIQPAAGDAGGSLGVALALWHRYLQKPRVSAERAGAWTSAKT